MVFTLLEAIFNAFDACGKVSLYLSFYLSALKVIWDPTHVSCATVVGVY